MFRSLLTRVDFPEPDGAEMIKTMGSRRAPSLLVCIRSSSNGLFKVECLFPYSFDVSLQAQTIAGNRQAVSPNS